MTSLMLAVRYRQREVIRLLLERGANLDLQSDKGYTALMMAVDPSYSDQFNYYHRLDPDSDILKALLAKHPNLDHQDIKGYTALMIAAEDAHDDVVRMLKKAGASTHGMANPALLGAIKSGKLTAVRRWLAVGASANAKTREGAPALVLAARLDRVAISKALLTAGADVNGIDESLRKETALIEAALKHDATLVRMLLAAGANVNAKNQDEWTALWWSADSSLLVSLLLDYGADVRMPANSGETPLMRAVGSLAAFRLLLDHGADVHIVDRGGKSVLMYAVDLGADPQVVRMLLEQGFSPNALNTVMGGETVLMRAAKQSNAVAVRILLDHGASVDAKDSARRTALFYAATPQNDYYKDDWKAAKALIDAGADVNARDADGQTPLLYALHYEASTSPAILETLLDSGSDINAATESGTTVLMRAAANPNLQYRFKAGSYRAGPSLTGARMIRTLLDRGANVNATNKRGETALFYARGTDLKNRIKTLVAAGANINAQNEQGDTPLMQLMLGDIGGLPDLKIYLDCGADVNMKDHQGRTALAIAREAKQKSVIKWLEKAGAK